MHRAYQYHFDLDISRVNLEIPFVCSVELWWAKGSKKIATKRKIYLTGREKSFEVAYRLSMIANCQLEQGTFSSKPSTIHVVIICAGGNKSGGHYNLYLTSVLKSYDPLNPVSRMFDVPIQNCPTNNGRLHFGLSARCLQEISSGSPNHSFNDEKMTSQSTKHNPNDITFRAEERALLSNQRHPDLDFSFQQDTRRYTMELAKPYKYFGKPHGYGNSDSYTFYQLLYVKRKLDYRNTYYAKLHQYFIQQFEKASRIESENKHRDLRLMNYINNLNKINEDLKKQLAYETQRANRYASKIESLLKKSYELQNYIYRKQSEVVSIESLMSNRLKETAANNEKLTYTIGILNVYLKNNQMELYKYKQLSRKNIESFEHSNRRIVESLYQTHRRSQYTLENKVKNYEEKIREKDILLENLKKYHQIVQYSVTLKLSEQQNLISCLKSEINKMKYYSFSKQNNILVKLTYIDKEKEKLVNEHYYVVQYMLNKIKTLYEMVESKDAILRDKQNIIDKAKEYVEFKEYYIQKRDAFINKAKEYMQGREMEFEKSHKGIYESLKEKDRVIAELRYQIDQARKIAENSMTREKSTSEYWGRYRDRILQENTKKYQYIKHLSEDYERKLSERDSEIEFLKASLEYMENYYEALLQHTRGSMEYLAKQNAQYQLQIKIFSNEVKNLQDQLEYVYGRLRQYEDKTEDIIKVSILREHDNPVYSKMEKSKTRLRHLYDRMRQLYVYNSLN